MSAHELVSLVDRIRSNAAAGLADPCSLNVERLERDGWRPHSVIEEWQPRPIFSNPIASDDG